MPKMFLQDMDEDFKGKARTTLEESWQLKGSCWEWPGEKTNQGYGRYRKMAVHRLSWALFNGDFEVGAFVCHRCDNPICYNPAHLYVGDSKNNGADASKRNRIVSRSIYKKQTPTKEQA